MTCDAAGELPGPQFSLSAAKLGVQLLWNNELDLTSCELPSSQRVELHGSVESLLGAPRVLHTRLRLKRKVN